MTNDLVSPEVAKSAEGTYLKLEPDVPIEFILYKPVAIQDAEAGDNLKFFRKVVIKGTERHIKYVIHLKNVSDGEAKEWQVGSPSAINQLLGVGAKIGDTISIEKIKLGERPQDVRYRIKLVKKAGEDAVAASTPLPEEPSDPVSDDDINSLENIPM